MTTSRGAKVNDTSCKEAELTFSFKFNRIILDSGQICMETEYCIKTHIRRSKQKCTETRKNRNVITIYNKIDTYKLIASRRTQRHKNVAEKTLPPAQRTQSKIHH